MLETVIALVNDLVDGVGRCRAVRVCTVVSCQRLRDFNQPLLKLLGGASIQGWHGAHHASDALGDHQLGVADDDQRCQ